METLLIDSYFFAHDFSGKPVPTFPDRALMLIWGLMEIAQAAFEEAGASFIGDTDAENEH
jgi:hypothetical protein